MSNDAYTPAAIENYHAYEKVRSSSIFNMFDPLAQVASNLCSQDYEFVRKNYSALRKYVEETGQGES